MPRDVQLCELANPAKWDNPEWMALFRELRILPDEKPQMHRKGYRRYRHMPIDLISLPYQTPHLVVKVGQTVFTSVIAFFERR